MKKSTLSFLISFLSISLGYICIAPLEANAFGGFNTTRSNRDRTSFTADGDLVYCKSVTEKSKTDYEYKPQKADCATVSKETSVIERHNWLCKYDPEFCAFFGIPPILD